MVYTYESLGDERFQQLCQAVLTTIYPDVQCLPVGQPDGGRDAVSRRQSKRNRVDAVVFQVKYSKNPSSKDERTVVEELVRTEAPKVMKLISKGMERYYILTNVSGTAHQEVGAIDRVNTALSEAFGIPAICWWRDDLDRRIDANASIKWSYSEILRGSDILQGLYEGKFGGEEKRRLAAINAYLAHQHKYDSQLKFKQVDLEKGIIDLFIDVPAAAVGPADPRDREKWRERFNLSRTLAALVDETPRRYERDEEGSRIGAVQALSDALVASSLPRVVIEGAPGQGKSTVTQFLCQLHRMILLKKVTDLQKVEKTLRPTDVRLPFRVDLRDYATWLSGRSPFLQNTTHTNATGLSPTLESFLAAQVSAQSGGMSFTPDDLVAVAANSALLIVLDGFDEIADVATRNRVVREVSDTSSRLQGNTLSYQIIVTSRPAAFANSPGFPRDDWQHIKILSLTRPLILAYAEKWTSGRELDRHERQGIMSVLEEKLEYSHVRDLARNPMQLAILLALISTQGESLPDKRTTLYDRYIEIFLNRESEKNKVVRDNRELLIDMHRYLAWTLQVEVESDAKAGNISDKKLRELLRAYLLELGHDASLVDVIFVGMVERVVALVSRVQGTYEFEVQPLREYFAARYLYETAPHIQAGSSRSGSIMDRFDALARNAYWLNVTRFYCGCYHTGELPSLVDGLIHVGQSEQYVGTSYISDLSLTLLGDYVFNQQPRSVTRLTDFLFESDRFRLLLAKQYSPERAENLTLPEKSGRKRLADAAIAAYQEAHTFDTAYASSILLKANSEKIELISLWENSKDHLSIDAIQSASLLGVFQELPVHDLTALVEKDESALKSCFYRNRTDVFSLQPDLWKKLITTALDGQAMIVGMSRARASSKATATPVERSVRVVLTIVGLLSTLNSDRRFFGRTLYELSIHYPGDIRFNKNNGGKSTSTQKPKETLPLSESLITSAHKLGNMSLVKGLEIKREIQTFLSLLETEFGYRNLIIEAAIAVLDWFEDEEAKDSDFSWQGMLADLETLKLNRNNPEFWLERVFNLPHTKASQSAIKAYLCWADVDVVAATIKQASLVVDSLSVDEFQSIYLSDERQYMPYPPKAREPLKLRLQSDFLRGVLGCRLGAVLAQRVDGIARNQIFEEALLNYSGSDPNILDARVGAAWSYSEHNSSFWPQAVSLTFDAYKKGVVSNGIRSVSPVEVLPLPEARVICHSPSDFPLTVLTIAERVLAERVGSQAIAIGSIAARDQWFADL